MNMIVIVGVQIAALGTGLVTFYISKPALIVSLNKTFFVISKSEVDSEAFPDRVKNAFKTMKVPEFVSNSSTGTLDFDAYQPLSEYGGFLSGRGRKY